MGSRIGYDSSSPTIRFREFFLNCIESRWQLRLHLVGRFTCWSDFDEHTFLSGAIDTIRTNVMTGPVAKANLDDFRLARSRKLSSIDAVPANRCTKLPLLNGSFTFPGEGFVTTFARATGSSSTSGAPGSSLTCVLPDNRSSFLSGLSFPFLTFPPRAMNCSDGLQRLCYKKYSASSAHLSRSDATLPRPLPLAARLLGCRMYFLCSFLWSFWLLALDTLSSSHARAARRRLPLWNLHKGSRWAACRHGRWSWFRQ